MTKKSKILVLAVLALVLVLLVVITLVKSPYTGTELETSPEAAIAEELSGRDAPVEAGDISLIARCGNDKEQALVFEYDGRLMSAIAVKTLIGDRYQLACADLQNGDEDEEDTYDPEKPAYFLLHGYSAKDRYAYLDGEFTLDSSAKATNEDVKNVIIRAVAFVVIVAATIFVKPKQEEK